MIKHDASKPIIPCPLPTGKKFVNLTGEKFGRLTVGKFIGKRCYGNPSFFFSCLCDCGKTIEVRNTDLTRGIKTHCGCAKNKPLQRVEYKCGSCSKIVMRLPCQVKGKRRIFCSKKCMDEYARKPIEETFWENVVKGNGCWMWSGASVKGYGIISRKISGHLKAHRFSWELHFGPIPDGLWVLHECDTPLCCNPKHLFLGTPQDNSDDCVQKKRHAFGEKCGTSKLKEVEVLKIRSDYSTGKLTSDQLASEHGVDRATIRSIVTGRSWKHLITPAMEIATRSLERRKTRALL